MSSTSFPSCRVPSRCLQESAEYWSKGQTSFFPPVEGTLVISGAIGHLIWSFVCVLSQESCCLVIYCDATKWTQTGIHARQAPYPWVTLSTFLFNIFKVHPEFLSKFGPRLLRWSYVFCLLASQWSEYISLKLDHSFCPGTNPVTLHLNLLTRLGSHTVQCS